MNANSVRVLTLIEVLICISLFILLTGMLMPLVSRGLDVSHTTSEAIEAVQSTELTLQLLAPDIRQAKTITRTEDSTAPLVQFHLWNGADVTYHLTDETLVRREVRNGRVKEHSIHGPFSAVQISQDSKHSRLIHIALSIRLRKPLFHQEAASAKFARFQTAYAMRAQGNPR
ncbi:MAG: PulJ/GspJ family protein [Planctomycetota bacterium]|jgi:type II secretory pathway pseudopilin PulG